MLEKNLGASILFAARKGKASFMIRADYKDKALVVDILSRSFDDNKSVNYIITILR